MNILFVGHGSNNDEYNQIYYIFISEIQKINRGKTALLLLSNGCDKLSSITDTFPKNEEIILIPLMVANGSHVTSEIFGDNKKSLIFMLKEKGYKVLPYKKSLLECILSKNLHQKIWEEFL